MTLHGYIDIATRTLLAGWALDPNAPDAPVSLLVTVDDVLAARVLANRFRVDLAEAAMGDGRHSFMVPLGNHLSALGGCVLRVRREGDGAELPGSPVILPAASGFDEAAQASVADLLATPCDDAEFAARLAFLVGQTEQLLQGRADRRSRRHERLEERHRWRWSGAGKEGAGLRPRALVIDERAPARERDAGSDAVLSHMAALQRLGCEVTFTPADMQPATDPAVLDAAGIGCCCLPWHASVEEVLRREAGAYDLVYLHRIAVAERYTALVRHHLPRARLIYSVADLHHLRLARQAAAEQRPELAARGRHRQAAELAAAWSADAVVTHSPVEAALLRPHLPPGRVHLVRWAVPACPTRVPFEARHGVAFIGHYGHQPNVDAALWLAETIMPLVHALDPDLECLLVGTSMPQLLRQTWPGVTPVGQVADLGEVFDRVRLTVAPLAYGAGVKGKVVASLAAGIPCICTPVAAEGLDLSPLLQTALVVTEAQEIAAAIHRLHRDEKLNVACGADGLQTVARDWSEAAVDAALREAAVLF